MAPASPVSQSKSRDLSIIKHFRRLKDPRRTHGQLHNLQDIIVIAMCAIIGNAQDWQEVVIFANEHHEWLKTFLALPHGIPSHDTFERVFDRINPRAFHGCFREWVAALQETLAIKHIAIDGKSVRGSRTLELGPLHLVSAWATGQQLSLGQVAVSDKSNEITAIPKLLQLLDLNGALVTIDAMGCQKAIAAKIIERKGDYALMVKGNQEHLEADIEAAFVNAFENDFVGVEHDVHTTTEKGHGREEVRVVEVLHTTAGVRNAAEWQNLTTLGKCYRRRTVKGVVSEQTTYFIASKRAGAKYYARNVRAHWGIENNLHWQLDVTYKEDDNRVTNRHEVENLALLRRMTLPLLHAHPAKLSIAKKRYKACVNTSFLEEILRADGILGNR